MRALAGELGIIAAADNQDAVRGAETVLLAVKPQGMPAVLAGLREEITPKQLVISIAAGVSIATLESGLAPGVPAVRAMPNLPAVVGAGATALAGGTHAREEHLRRALALFGAVGLAVSVDERLLDAATGICGSGPAYVCLLMEAMADAGVSAGISRALAQQIAAQTVAGTGRMLLETGCYPAAVIERVCTSGGATAVGVASLERAGWRGAVVAAVGAAAARAGELGRAGEMGSSENELW